MDTPNQRFSCSARQCKNTQNVDYYNLPVISEYSNDFSLEKDLLFDHIRQTGFCQSFTENICEINIGYYFENNTLYLEYP